MAQEATRPLPPRRASAEATRQLPPANEEPIELGEAEPGAAVSREFEAQPEPGTDREQLEGLLEQLRRTSEARFRQFSDDTGRLEARLTQAGAEAGAEDAAAGVARLQDILGRAKNALVEFWSRVGAVANEQPSVPQAPASAERIRVASDPSAFADEVEARLEILSPFASEQAANVRAQVDAFRGMIEERNMPNADMLLDESFEGKFREAELGLHKSEALLEYLALETTAVPGMLKEAPGELHRQLREGREHASRLVETAYRQFKSYESDPPVPPNPVEVTAKYVSERARPAYRLLRSDRIPEAFRAEARRASNQLAGGYYEDAARTVSSLAEAVGIRELAAAVPEITEAGKIESSRAERLAEKARELYGTLLQSPESAERHESVRERMEREEAFRDGEIVAMRPLDQKDHLDAEVTQSYSPVWARIQHKGKTYDAVVKFDMSDRWTRAGVSPGASSLREALGALAQVAMGNDLAPAVVSRNTEQYGRVTVMDFVPARSCSRVDDWFVDAAGDPHPDMAMLATRDFLLRRTDGAPRNLLEENGRIVPIDFGSDFASPIDSEGDVDYSSAAHYVLDAFKKPVGQEVISFLDRWETSPARALLEDAVALLPENMDGYGASMQERIDALRRAFASPPPRFPAYPKDGRTDFGKWFLRKLADVEPAEEQPAARDNATFV